MAQKAEAEPTTTFFRYTDAQWAEIACLLPAQKWLWMGDARFELEQMGRQLWAMRRVRAWTITVEGVPDYDARKDCERLRRCLCELVQVQHPALVIPLQPGHQAISAVAEWLDHMSGEGFQRTSDPYRELLYDRVILLWRYSLGGKLSISEDGPLARFLDAVLAPILVPATLSRRGIKAILERRRELLGKPRRAKKRRARQSPKIFSSGGTTR
jgi:hypothetical protein